MKVTDSYWFTNPFGGLVGIVVGLDEVTGKPKAYIGSLPVSTTEGIDARAVAEQGSKLHLSTLLEIVAKLTEPRDKQGKVKKPA